MLAKAKPMSSGGCTSVITYLRGRKNTAVRQQLRERSEMM